MKPPVYDVPQGSLFYSFDGALDPGLELYVLVRHICWERVEKAFARLYCPDNGRPAKPIRLMTGLLILKHLRSLSDESLVGQWKENVYFQYFCGQTRFSDTLPCTASELVHFRRRIGQKGLELILHESVRLNGEDGQDDRVSFDTTVQEKNITLPTDTKQHLKIIERCRKIAEKEGVVLRRSFRNTEKSLRGQLRLSRLKKRKREALKAARRTKIIAGRLVRELRRKLPAEHAAHRVLAVCKLILKQGRKDKDKVYSLHEPQVCCISKGKEHKKYEFGNKVGLARTSLGVIVGVMSFRNPHDGHTLGVMLEQVKSIVGKAPRIALVDRGYRGLRRIGDTEVIISGQSGAKGQAGEKRKRRRWVALRATIKPVIGHLKSDHRLGVTSTKE